MILDFLEHLLHLLVPLLLVLVHLLAQLGLSCDFSGLENIYE